MSDRPHCLRADACVAKHADRHCVACTAQMPEVRARKSAAMRQRLSDPAMREKWKIAAQASANDPGIIANRNAANARHRLNPEFRAKHAEACRAAKLARMADPEFMVLLMDAGERLGNWNRQNVADADMRSAWSVARQRARLAWCPQEFWGVNRALRLKGFRLDERKEMIAAEVARIGRVEIEAFNRRQRERIARERAQAY